MSKRIPQHFIDELLTRTDIVTVIERYLPLKKAGSNYACLCPFHQEKSPSFSVSPAKQFYYCFGCGASGNAIGFLMAYEHLNFVEAIESLAGHAGMEIPQQSQPDGAQADHQVLFDVLGKSEQYYRVQLHRHAESAKALSYLEGRGLSQDVMKRFGVGYAPSGWDNLLQYFAKHQQSQTVLLKAGLLTENENGKRYDRFRERIMFPIRDRRGRVIGFGGRVLDDSAPKYLNSPETAIFHKGQELYGFYEARLASRDLQQLLVVEGYMDVIALAEHGIDFAVATLGTAVTTQHLQKLLRSSKRTIFCFDGDLAGQKAAWKALEIAMPLVGDHVEVRFVFMPQGEDPDSFVRKYGRAVFLEQLDKADSLSDFFLAHLSEQVNLETLAGRAQLVAQAMPYLQKMTAVVTKELMLMALSQLSHTNVEQLRHWSGELGLTLSEKKTPKKPSAPRLTPIRYAIALLLQHPQLACEIDENLPQAQIPGLSLLHELVELLREHPHLKAGSVFEHWRERPELKYLTQLASQEILIPESGVLDEMRAIFKHLRQQAVLDAIEVLIAKANKETLNEEEKVKLQNLLSYKKTHV